MPRIEIDEDALARLRKVKKQLKNKGYKSPSYNDVIRFLIPEKE
jgi:predicted CopG family antitoxin